MAEERAFGFTDDPEASDNHPVLTHKPVYVELGTTKTIERWHAVSTVCPQCGERLVTAATPDGERLVLVVSARTFRLRLTAQKDGYLAERSGGYPEHGCSQHGGRK
jgi:hypothetical protein